MVINRQGRLLILAALFLLFYSAALTLAPAARARSWSAGFNLQHWLGFLTWVAAVFLIHTQIVRRLPDCDPFLFPTAALLSGWGVLTIWRLYPSFGLRQTLWLGLILGLLLISLRYPSPLGFLKRYKYVWLTGGLLLTGLTLLFGTNPAGNGLPRLWLGCCGIYLQPSEPLKLLLIVYLSAYLSGWAGGSGPISAKPVQLLPLLAPTLLMAGLALLLLLAQRDLGTASIFLFLYTTIVYLASGQRRILAAGGLAVVAAGVVGYALFEVVRIRIDAWINPWLDPSGRSYQIVQSLLSIANGGVLGRGPGIGSPGLVPVPHSDFIFAAITEESGLVGAIGLLLLLALLTDRGLRIALSAQEPYHRFLAAGLTTHLVAQSILIIGGNLRLLPLTGVTLPFVSYGGSSLLTSFFSLLLLLHISHEARSEPGPISQSRPYLQLGAFLLCGLAAAGLATGWWAVYRGPDLLARTDNPRRMIADHYVRRGSILDRSNQPLSTSQGEPGSYTRQIHYPDLSPIIGYTNSIYGQTGLEASLDGYLRGVQGNPGIALVWNYLLYGQPPPGLDVRLSLDLNLQRTADQLLAGRSGALVLLDAESGEILAMASHPTFDANLLEDNWDTLIQDPKSPLLNRAVLGRYPAGDLQGRLFPGGLSDPRLDTQPQIRLPSGELILSSDTSLMLSPLQAALGAATLSASGERPAPRLVLAVRTPQDGWVMLPALGEPVQASSQAEVARQVEEWKVENLSIWENLAVAPNGPEEQVTWYIGGSLPDWEGAPLAVAVLLEEDDPNLAQEIGQGILRAAMQLP